MDKAEADAALIFLPLSDVRMFAGLLSSRMLALQTEVRLLLPGYFYVTFYESNLAVE